MKYFEMFTGIAGFSKGIEQAYDIQIRQQISDRHQPVSAKSRRTRYERRNGEENSTCECIGFSEIAKTPSAILRYLYPDIRNYGDASLIVPEELPDFDFLVGGFPCQAFSIAGKRKGFEDTRGTLFFEIARILAAKRPGHFLLENVAGLLSHDNGQTFRTIIAAIDEIGYDAEWTVINSKHHGVPQNRERVFIVGHLRNGCTGQVFSIGEGGRETVSPGYVEPISGTISTKNQSGQCQFDGSSTLVVGQDITVGTLRTHKDGEGFREMQSGVSPALNARARQDGSQQPIVAIPVLTSDRPVKRQNERYKVENCIRRLTPVECMRLQGFPDDWCDFGINEKGETYAISDTGKYQCAGNAVTVNVIEAIVTRMIDEGCL